MLLCFCAPWPKVSSYAWTRSVPPAVAVGAQPCGDLASYRVVTATHPPATAGGTDRVQECCLTVKQVLLEASAGTTDSIRASFDVGLRFHSSCPFSKNLRWCHELDKNQP